MMWPREAPTSLRPGPVRPKALVAITISLRAMPTLLIAFASVFSDSPLVYTSAVSTKFTPASKELLSNWSARSWPTPEICFQMPSPAANVIVPRQISETRRPVGPSVLYFMRTFAGLGFASTHLDVATLPGDSWESRRGVDGHGKGAATMEPPLASRQVLSTVSNGHQRRPWG